jgi:EmrB/QacA subfamily drug resistance transporter
MTTAADPTLSSAPTASAVRNLHADRWRWLALAFLAMGVAMVMIDATIVNVAIPAITADLHLQPTDIEWVNSIYSLTFAALLITAGKAGDVFGRRRMFITGGVVFLLASIIAARSQSGEVLIFGRFVQGIGGAMMIPASLSLVNTIFRGRDRAIAFAVWGATIGTVSAIGPLLGGWITTAFSWRWAFLINLPIAILLVVGSLTFVPESRDPDARRGVDLPGVLLSAFGLAAVVFGLIEGQRFGWWAPTGPAQIGPFTWNSTAISPVPVAITIGVLLLIAFVQIERARGRADRVIVLDITLFRIRSFRWGLLSGMVIMFGEFGILLTLPLFLQNVLGFSAVRSGATLAMVMVGALISAPASGALTRRRNAIFTIRVGLIIEAIAMTGLAFAYTPTATQWNFVPWLILFGVAVGFSTAQLQNAILTHVPVSKSGQASGTSSTSRQLGTALGVAVLGAVLWMSLGSLVTAGLSNGDVFTQAQAERISQVVVGSSGTIATTFRTAARDGSNGQTPTLPAGTPPEVATAVPFISQVVDSSYSTATRRATLVGAGFVLVGWFATLAMGSARTRRDESGELAP